MIICLARVCTVLDSDIDFRLRTFAFFLNGIATLGACNALTISVSASRRVWHHVIVGCIRQAQPRHEWRSSLACGIKRLILLLKRWFIDLTGHRIHRWEVVPLNIIWTHYIDLLKSLRLLFNPLHLYFLIRTRGSRIRSNLGQKSFVDAFILFSERRYVTTF